MGYTHYFGFNKPVTSLAKVVKDLKQLDLSILAGPLGHGKPKITNDVILFNGRDENSHESFLLEVHSTEEDFCKTAAKPYDFHVCYALISAHVHYGLVVTSDGDYDDWKEIVDTYEKNNKVKLDLPWLNWQANP